MLPRKPRARARIDGAGVGPSHHSDAVQARLARDEDGGSCAAVAVGPAPRRPVAMSRQQRPPASRRDRPVNAGGRGRGGGGRARRRPAGSGDHSASGATPAAGRAAAACGVCGVCAVGEKDKDLVGVGHVRLREAVHRPRRQQHPQRHQPDLPPTPPTPRKPPPTHSTSRWGRYRDGSGPKKSDVSPRPQLPQHT